MTSRVRFESVHSLLTRDAPPFVLSLLIAELFFKFGSFALECLTFLGLWYALDWSYMRFRGRRRGATVNDQPASNL